MNCLYPNVRVVSGYHFDKKAGEVRDTFKIMSLVKYEENKLKIPNYEKNFLRVDRIPCGQCLACRLNYAKEWSARCIAEASLYKHNYFVTLTYDDDHLPTEAINSRTGELVHNDYGVLKYKDLQNFNKRLRKRFHDKFDHVGIRFFASGEYGEKFGRPHFHVIYFNLPIPDLVQSEKSHKGMPLFDSELLSSIWKNGFVKIGEVTPESAGYTARYNLKKIKGPNAEEYYSSRHQIPERSSMSRKPGIAHDYFISHEEDIFNTLLMSDSFKHPVSPPRAFFAAFEDEFPYTVYESKKRLKLASIDKREAYLFNAGRTDLEDIAFSRFSLSSKTRCLKRNFDKIT